MEKYTSAPELREIIQDADTACTRSIIAHVQRLLTGDNVYIQLHNGPAVGGEEENTEVIDGIGVDLVVRSNYSHGDPCDKLALAKVALNYRLEILEELEHNHFEIYNKEDFASEYEDQIGSEPKAYQVIVCEAGENTVHEVSEDLLVKPNTKALENDWEFIYAMRDEEERILALEKGESLYFQPNRDDKNTKGIILRIK